MFIKRGEGQIINVVKEEELTDEEKENIKKLAREEDNSKANKEVNDN